MIFIEIYKVAPSQIELEFETWTWKTFIRQNSTQHVQKTHKNETLQTMY